MDKQLEIKINDPRTERTYLIRADRENFDRAIERVRDGIDSDYFHSLSPDEKYKIKKKDEDFTCPHCLKKAGFTIKKLVISRSLFFGTSSNIIDCFQCAYCHNEFTEEELRQKRDQIRGENILLEKHYRDESI